MTSPCSSGFSFLVLLACLMLLSGCQKGGGVGDSFPYPGDGGQLPSGSGTIGGVARVPVPPSRGSEAPAPAVSGAEPTIAPLQPQVQQTVEDAPPMEPVPDKAEVIGSTSSAAVGSGRTAPAAPEAPASPAPAQKPAPKPVPFLDGGGSSSSVVMSNEGTPTEAGIASFNPFRKKDRGPARPKSEDVEEISTLGMEELVAIDPKDPGIPRESEDTQRKDSQEPPIERTFPKGERGAVCYTCNGKGYNMDIIDNKSGNRSFCPVCEGTGRYQ